MNIQSSIYTSALQQPNFSVTDRSTGSQQMENDSVSTRPVERVIQAEPSEQPSEQPALGGQLDIFV